MQGLKRSRAPLDAASARAARARAAERKRRRTLERRTRVPSRRSLRQQKKDCDGKELPPDFKDPTKAQMRQYTVRQPDPEGSLEISPAGDDFLKSLQEQLANAGATGGKSAKSGKGGKGGEMEYAKRLAQLSVH